MGARFPGDNDIVLLGDNFFFDYYVHYDPSNKRIGLLGPNKKAPDMSMLGFMPLNLMLVTMCLFYLLV
jgi:hypothetical protein